jgi:enterochelin esterase-like enzyme
MVVDHVAGPSMLSFLTGGNRFLTSAAEGFIVISGLVVGNVYRRKAERDGLSAALRRLLGRAWQLYVLAVGLTLVTLALSEALHLPWARGIDLSDAPALIVSIVTLHRTYYLADVPLLYALLLLAAPAVLVLMCSGKTWVVLLASWLIWLSYQVYPEWTEYPWPIAGNALFYFSAWQVLFFTAMTLGYHQERARAAFRPVWRRPLLAASAVGFLLVLAVFHHADPILQAVASGQQSAEPANAFSKAQLALLLFAKGSVGPGRILASVMVFAFLYLLATELWTLLQRAIGWLFVPLGQNALYAYSAHIVLILVLAIVTAEAGLPAQTSSVVNACIQVASVALIWLAIRYRILYPTDANRRWWMTSPIVVIAALIVLLPLDPSPGHPGLQAPAVSAAPAPAVRVFGTPIPPERACAIAAMAGTSVAGGQAVPMPQAPQAMPEVRATAEVQSTPVALSAMSAEATAAPATPVPTAVPLSPALAVAAPSTDPRGVSEYVGPISGTFHEARFYSAALGRDMSYFVYLPPGYATDGQRYPTLYMLHGLGGYKEEWPAHGLVDTLDALITTKDVRPIVLVMPQGDYGYWVNHVNGGPRWGDYVEQDLVGHVDATYRSLPSPEHRAVGGLSMGAYGALQLAMNDPDVFGVAGAHSPTLHAEDGSLPILGAGQDFARRDPISLAATAPGLERLRIWVDNGEEDPWLGRSKVFYQALEERGLAVFWNVLPGGHDDAYWQRHIPTYLRFYDSALH